MGVEVEDQSIMGTRVIMLASGTSLSFSKPKNDGETIKMTIAWVDRVHNKSMHKDILLQADEALSIIEILAVAARPHTGKTLVEAICEHYDVRGGLLVKGSDG